MTVKVYDNSGSSQVYDADGVDTTGDVLWVTKGEQFVAVYAPGKWINADLEAGE